ncbi:hypothetical protein C9J27_02930 [Photobacterium kishitanii]|uniref:Uncharacterized protein n=1 Tax=Photobacterium kishitanii TaxID=318456 RepID=A0A2T3KMH2_9GAMM|nr:hypothetical protein C9J27_02930 [Photobacterium kishitanii]
MRDQKPTNADLVRDLISFSDNCKSDHILISNDKSKEEFREELAQIFNNHNFRKRQIKHRKIVHRKNN